MSTIEYSTFMSHGCELSVGVIGNGPPIMLVPGTLQSANRWIDAGYVDALADDYRLLLFDPLGHGRSERSTEPADYAPDRLVGHLADALDHVGEPSATFWGYSRGAAMSTHFTSTHPERVRSLVFGGYVLFDAGAVLESLGMGPDIEARAASEHRAAAGDWEAFWETFPVPLPDESKQMLQEGNDPAVQTAASQGGRLGSMVWEPTPVPSLAYWGDAEIFHALNLDNVIPPLESFTVPGGHADGFSPCEPVLAGVLPFLERRAAG